MTLTTAPPTARIKVLVVDDSAFMRKAISKMLESDPEIQVVGTASNGKEGIDKVALLKPDLVTMDIEMPTMDGLTALRHIMQTNPTPVMMLSSLTSEGAHATLDALDQGAVDFVAKQMSFVSLDIVKIQEELIAKIKNIARRKNLLMSRFRQKQIGNSIQAAAAAVRASSELVKAPRRVSKKNHTIGLIVIGSSTGGPPALQEVVQRFPATLPVGVIIAQHMPAAFTRLMAERLNSVSQVTVREATDGEEITPGTVFVAPGGQHLRVKKIGSLTRAQISPNPADTLYRPCVDITVQSVAEQFGSLGLGVILTGMGSNGVIGLKELKNRGGVVIAQDEQTCVVYGMPRAAVEAGIVDRVLPLSEITDEITSYF